MVSLLQIYMALNSYRQVLNAALPVTICLSGGTDGCP